MDIGDKPLGSAKAWVNTIVKPLDLLLIRDDGYLCMGNTDILAYNPRLRVYHGSVKDDWDTRMKFLSGQAPISLLPMIDPGKVDITRMNREDLINFALDEYGIAIPEDAEYGHVLVAVVKARQEQEEVERKAGPPPKSGKKTGIGARAA